MEQFRGYNPEEEGNRFPDVKELLDTGLNRYEIMLYLAALIGRVLADSRKGNILRRTAQEMDTIGILETTYESILRSAQQEVDPQKQDEAIHGYIVVMKSCGAPPEYFLPSTVSGTIMAAREENGGHLEGSPESNAGKSATAIAEDRAEDIDAIRDEIAKDIEASNKADEDDFFSQADGRPGEK